MALLWNCIQESRFVDCSHPIDEESSFWPGGEPLIRCRNKILDKDKCNKLRVTMGTDLGTHIDSPSHFIAGGRTITDLSLQELISPAVIINVTEKVEKNHDYELTVEDLKDWEEKHGRIPDNSLVCMRTGWSKRFRDQVKYRNSDEQNVMHFPGFSSDLASFLVAERNINGIGIDTLSLDPGTTKSFPVHYIVLGKGKYQIENMVLEELPEKGAVIIALPLSLRDAPESQTRVMAMIPKN